MATTALTLRGERRPDRRLLGYYLLQSILTGPFLIFVVPFFYFRFRTLRYVFDDEGVTVRWGVLFRREVSLTYARIQDIHLKSNLIERWLGLGRVSLQTASGSSGAEMEIEGLPDFEAIRDELYRRMRGAGGQDLPAETDSPAESASLQAVTDSLNAAVEELRALRAELRQKS